MASSFVRRRAVVVPSLLLLAAVALPGQGGPAGASTPGPTWTPAQATVPAVHTTPPSTELRSTSCPAPGYCVAVGATKIKTATTTFTPPYEAPVIEVYTGGKWAAATAPLPPDARTGAKATASLTAVSCGAPGSCVAIGNYASAAGTTLGYIATLSGGTWVAGTAPLPTGATGSYTLADVTCPAAGSCVAVGTYGIAGNANAGLVLTLAGGAWTATTAPVPSTAQTGLGQGAELFAVACASATSCAADGSFQTKTDGQSGLLLSLSGSTWSATAAPLSHPATGHETDVDFQGVSCGGPGSCVAVGDYRSTNGDFVALLDTLSGGSWRNVSTTVPADAEGGTTQSSQLTRASCPAPGSCVAVGSYKSTTDRAVPLVDTLTSGTWVPASPGLPPGSATGNLQTAQLDGVSCSAPGWCVAVGGYTDGIGYTAGLIEATDGGAWSPTTAPEPANGGTDSDNEQYAYLAGVSCVGGSCAAAGTYTDATHGRQGLLETTGTNPAGYFEAASDGGIFAFTVPFHGSMGGKPLNAPIVTAAADPLTGGYYEVAADGGMFAFTAPFHGSMGGKPLNEPIVGMAFDTRTGGYYEVASDGGLFAFTAPFHGSMGGKPLNEPIVGMAFDPVTGGYWEVASDGGLFAFTAPFLGSMGGKPLVKPIVGMTYDSLTGGYYEVATDGGLFAFTAPFHGSMGGQPLNEPVVGMAFDYGTGVRRDLGGVNAPPCPASLRLGAGTCPWLAPEPQIHAGSPMVTRWMVS